MRVIQPCIYQGFLRLEDTLVLQKPFVKVCKLLKKEFGGKTILLKSMGILLFFYNDSMMQLNESGKLVIKRVRYKSEALKILTKVRRAIA